MISIFIYVAAIVVANLNVAHFGPAVTPTNAFFLIGLDLALRDSLHTRWEGRHLFLRMGLLIASAGLISFALNPAAGRIALASLVAFVASNAADTWVFHRLRARRYVVRANGSNLCGAAVDSLLFPLAAFGAFMPGIVLMQFAAKTLGGAVWVFLLSRLGRQGVVTEGAK